MLVPSKLTRESKEQGEERRGEERRGEERRGEESRGEERRGEERRGDKIENRMNRRTSSKIWLRLRISTMLENMVLASTSEITPSILPVGSFRLGMLRMPAL